MKNSSIRIKKKIKLLSPKENNEYINHRYLIQDWPHLTQEPQLVSTERLRTGRKEELFIIQF